MNKKYKFRFDIEFGGTALWSKNEDARERFGYPVQNKDLLPISQELKNELCTLEEEYQTALDWDYPPDPSPWTKEQAMNFRERALKAFNRLVMELGDEYEVEYSLTVPYGTKHLN